MYPRHGCVDAVGSVGDGVDAALREQRIRCADDLGVLLLVVEPGQEIARRVDPGSLYVVGFHRGPRCDIGVGTTEDPFLRFGVGIPLGCPRLRPASHGAVTCGRRRA